MLFRSELNDLGIVGVKVPKLDIDACRGCAKCAPHDSCPMGICEVKDGKLVIDAEKCNNCGVCVGKCHFGALDNGEVMHKIYIAGRWGKRIRLGTALNKLFTEDEVSKTIEKTILFFKEQGKSGERLSDPVE